MFLTLRVFRFVIVPRETWLRRPDFEPVEVLVMRRRCEIEFGPWRLVGPRLVG